MSELLQDFYIETSSTYDGQSLQFSSAITLKKNHAIYQGHFPQMPIAPGVCLIQMIQEILSLKLGKKLRLVEAQNIKFLSMINPQENEHYTLQFDCSLTDTLLSVSASYLHEGKTYVKFKGRFSTQSF